MSMPGKLRFIWAVLSSFVVESIIFGLAVLPGVLFWEWHLSVRIEPAWFRVVVLSMAFIPAYLLFALTLIVLSALVMRALGWQTPEDSRLPIREMSWPLMNWVRYMIAIQLVRIFAGSILKSTPVFAFYMRLNGARVGRNVYVNSLAVTDYNLLEFGDNVVIGGDAHLSGHTVEDGSVKTARVRLGSGVTVGVGSVVGIGVEAGDGCRIGALSVVPKFRKLDAGGTYVGSPAHKL